MKRERVQKILSNRGYCSRRKAEELIKEGRVKVNGKVISIGDQASRQDKIEVSGEKVTESKKIYLMFNKPKKCVTALTDKHHKTIMSYIEIEERVFPVGRLDYDTTGLLLLTNDGDFANKVMHPRNEVRKTYWVKLNNPIREEEIKKIRSGVMLRDGKTWPASVKKFDRTFLEVTIHEGRNQIVKRMFRKLGFRVKELKRVGIGRLKLGRLKSGEYRELSERERKIIF